MKRRVIVLVLMWTAVILWSAVIFLMSRQTGEESSQTSNSVTSKVVSVIFPDYDNLPEKEQNDIFSGVSFFVRKAAHFTEYFVLAFFAFFASKSTFAAENIIKADTISLVISILYPFLYAATDEIHQTAVAGRAGRLTDVIIDTCGAVAATLLCFAVTRRRKTNHLKKICNPSKGER